MDNYVNVKFRLFFEILVANGRISRIKNKEISEDLLQIVFLKFHRSCESYNSKYLLKPWIFTICKNTVIDYYKSSARNRNMENEIENETIAGKEIENDIDESIFNKLNLEQKNILDLRYKEELSYSDIASKLNISIVLARKRVSRAISKIRSSIVKKIDKTEHK